MAAATAMAANFGKCLYRGACNLNCQVFVKKEEDSVLHLSKCLACDHLAAFHEQPKQQKTAELIDLTSATCSAKNSSLESSGPSKRSFGKVKSYSDWLKDKRSGERGNKKQKVKDKSVQDVTITTGLMKLDKSMKLKKVWGKKLPVSVPSDATYSVILEKAVIKWKAFNSSIMEEDQEYLLLYEDGNQALYLPGEKKESFTLSRYKEELGKDYRRICLFLCPEDDFDTLWFHETSSDEESKDQKAKQKSTEAVPPSAKKAKTSPSRNAEDPQPSCSGYSNGNVLDDDFDSFFWGGMDEPIDEDELIKAAIARSLEQDIRPQDDVKLQELLQAFQDQVKQQEQCEVVILRKRLMQTCLVAIQEPAFSFSKNPSIHFSGEEAQDLGGPKREFFRLLLKNVCGAMGVFEGNQHALTFSHSHAVLERKKPFIAGQLLAWSLLHGGPGLHALSEDTYFLMLELPQNINTSRAISVISDEETASIAKQLYESTDDQEFLDVKSKNMTWLLDHGINMNNASKDDVLIQVIKESLYYRVKPSMDQFIAGMDSVGQFFTNYVKKWPHIFLPLLVDTGEQLTINQFRGLYAVQWSEEGTNRRSEEEDTMYCFDQYLIKASYGSVPCSLADILMFLTGAERVPIHGFYKIIKIKFYDVEQGVQRRPSASTCALELYLPRGITDNDYFNSLMTSSLNESIGFGKV